MKGKYNRKFERMYVYCCFHNQNKKEMKNVHYLFILIFICIFAILQIVLIQKTFSYKSVSPLNSAVKKLQKGIESQKWKSWRGRRKYFRDQIKEIKEPVPENLESEKSLSLLPIYRTNLQKVRLN